MTARKGSGTGRRRATFSVYLGGQRASPALHPDPVPVALQSEIRGPGFDGRDGDVLADGAGHDYEWQVEANPV